MAFLITVEKASVGGGNAAAFNLPIESTRSVKVSTDIPIDANARTQDVGITAEIRGRVLVTQEDIKDGDVTKSLGMWAITPAEKADCYRHVTITLVQGGIQERKYEFPNAFVVSYNEKCLGEDGTGEYVLVIKQKKDKLDLFTVDGGSKHDGDLK